MRSAWIRAIVAVGLGLLALACQRGGEENADRSSSADPQAETSPSEEPVDPNAPPLIASAVPGATPPNTAIPLSSSPSSCTDPVEVLRACWTEAFPPDTTGGSHVTCTFTLQCCGTAVQRWTQPYPKSPGPSGVVFNDAVRITRACGDDLADLDGDGTPNTEDEKPFPASGEKGYPWN